MYILNYACTTAAGAHAEDLMQALYAGRDCSTPAEAPGRVCLIKDSTHKKTSYRHALQMHFRNLWQSLFAPLPTDTKSDLEKAKVGVIFASTKGYVEDFIWQATAENIRQQQDPFQGVLDDFCADHGNISWRLRCNISNACSSSHVALEYAQDLFESRRLDYVFVLAADLIGPFVFKGFSSLKVVSPTTNRPFSGDREGLQLGEAAAMFLLSRKSMGGGLKISRVASDTEGSSITRPSVNGHGLVRAMDKISASSHAKPDLVIAHGTGTKFNDLAEELALQQYLSKLQSTETPITNTKWAIGHTLGASGSVDLIAACEVLKRQRVFKIGNTTERDPIFRMNYLTTNASVSEKPLKQILISSLGFGGVHAALLVQDEVAT